MDEPIDPTAATWAWELLARAGRVLGTSLDLDETLRDLGRLLVPEAADAALVVLLDRAGQLTRQFVAVAPEHEADWGAYLREYPLTGRIENPLFQAIAGGESVLIQGPTVDDLRRFATSDEHLRRIVALGPREVMVLPLVARGHVVGGMTLLLVREGRTFGPTRRAMAEAIATRAALAIDTARLVAAERRAASRLRDREALLDLVTSHASAGLTVLNADRRFIFVNAGYSELLGLSVADVLHRGIADVLGPLYEPYLREPLDRAFAGESVFTDIEIPDRGAFVVSYEPRSDEAGRVTDVVMVVVNVTVQHAAVRARLESEERLRLAADSAGFAVWELDLAAQTVRVTPRWWALHGRPAEDRSPEVSEWWGWVHPEDVRQIRRAARTVRETGETDDEFRVVWPDGTLHWLAARSRLVPGSGGDRVLGVLFDVTARRELIERVIELQRSEAVGRLAGGVAHEVNNQMTVVLGAVEFLRRRPDLPAAAATDLEHIRRAAERSTQVTASLLAYSRRQVLQRDVIDLNAVLRDQEPVLRRILGRSSLGVRLAAEPAVIRADRAQIEQVLVNLVLNARDAMPGGGRVDIAVERVPSGIRLTVADTGEGMSSETLAHVFEPFFTTKPTGQGTGLGLSVVQGIVEQHQGTVRAHSEPGRGTTFVIDLPEAAGEVARPEATAARTPARGRGETVLLVDDEPLLRQTAVRALESAGYRVLPAASGQEAVDLVRDHAGPLDLVVTDIVMPGVDGAAVGRAVADLRPGVPVLYMSGHTDENLIGRQLTQAETDFLQKPFTPAVLVRAVARALEHRRGTEAWA